MRALPTRRLCLCGVWQATRAINDLMPRLLAELNGVEVLGANIAAVHFLCTQSGDMLVSLIYASPLPQPEWRAAAERLRSTLGVPALLGRAKGTCEVLGRDWVTERLRLADGRTLTYRQMEGSFSNPSAQMCEHTLNFLCAAAADCNASLARRRRADGSVGSTVDGASPLPKPNLLELYSGNGNHTVALAPLFGRVLTVEIDRRLCDAAAVNLEQNGISNACVLCAPSAKFCDRLLRRLRRPAEASLRAPTTATAAVQPSAPSAAAAATTAPCVANAPTPPESAEAAWLREARRCEVILVDPPRCGLDDTTRALVEQYEHVLYVSCNPVDALREDLKRLGEAYEVRRFAVFDHFAYTPHIECAVQLSRRSR